MSEFGGDTARTPPGDLDVAVDALLVHACERTGDRDPSNDAAKVIADGHGYAVEALPVENREFQHRRLIAMFGMAVSELWDLERLAEDCGGDGVYEFFFCSSPLYVPGAAGSPADAYAIK